MKALGLEENSGVSPGPGPGLVVIGTMFALGDQRLSAGHLPLSILHAPAVASVPLDPYWSPGSSNASLSRRLLELFAF